MLWFLSFEEGPDGNVFVRNMRAQVKMFDNPDKLSVRSSQLKQIPLKVILMF